MKDRNAQEGNFGAEQENLEQQIILHEKRVEFRPAELLGDRNSIITVSHI
jgi:hypothetical protein